MSQIPEQIRVGDTVDVHVKSDGTVARGVVVDLATYGVTIAPAGGSIVLFPWAGVESLTRK
ncbi:MAG: hypothetical protein ACR2RV_12000 [Verrucomicrobiales bacterium]